MNIERGVVGMRDKELGRVEGESVSEGGRVVRGATVKREEWWRRGRGNSLP